ncbi:MAG: hypothetical protein KBD73_02940 [Candidatus Magasanikbacteria bacterium]|nr:hypothetical protein [Candidatus Magasanikbacteria bacterium]
MKTIQAFFVVHYEKIIEYPQYTKSEKFMKWSVPEVLLSGNHEKIREWRKKQ